MKKENNGFTLVELIVTLLILAILAAILVPALLGYIDQAKDKQYMLNAKNCLNAIQGELTKYYATHGEYIGESNQNILGDIEFKEFNNGNNVDITKTKFAQSVIEKLDTNPYCVMFAAGFYGLKDKKYESSLHECYTVCYIYYQEEEDSAPLYYVNGEWTKKNPRHGTNNKPKDIMDKVGNYNIFKVGTMKNKAFRYYMVINNTKYIKNGYTDFGQLWAKVLELHSES